MQMKSIQYGLLALALVGVTSPLASATILLSGSSYSQNFNGLSSGLPSGWDVRTGASSSTLGTTTTIVATPNSASGSSSTNWGDTSARFFNAASASSPATATDVATVQAAAANRALAVRLTGSFGDPGAAFNVRFTDTLGFQGFNVSALAQMLSVQGRSNTYTLQWALGAAPTTFNNIATYTDPGAFGSTSIGGALPTAVDNQSQPLWIRFVNLAASTGANNRDTVGLDDFSLTYSASNPAPVINANSTLAATGSGFTVPTQSSTAAKVLADFGTQPIGSILLGTLFIPVTDDQPLSAANLSNSALPSNVLLDPAVAVTGGFNIPFAVGRPTLNPLGEELLSPVVTFTYTDGTSNDTIGVTFATIPEPTSIVALAGVTLLGLRRRRA
jgi:hypothetical protein